MGSVLSGEEISRLMEAGCHYGNPCFYFPVRHHSPVCAFFLKRVIREYRPDCILIEGPENANELIPDMTDEDTLAPFCIYYSYRDTKGLIDENKRDYRCYYPFLDASPELVALREGKRAGAELAFMDLPYEEILMAEKEGAGLRGQEEKNSYNDDRYLSENAFIRGVAERSGARSFDEFWERAFEMEGLLKPVHEFIRDMLFYCVLSRANTTEETLREDGCLAREAHMRMRISEARQRYARVLVVTGGFHVAGLLGPQAWLTDPAGREALGGDLFGTKLPEGLTCIAEGKKLHRIDEKDKGVYLMSYSLEAADRLNGYCSGMIHPMFYQMIWEGLSEKGGDAGEVYEETVLQFLVEVGKKVRRKEGYPSTFDEICALNMCRNLALLRGKPFPGVFELSDGVLSNYVKGEYQLATARPMRVLREELTGKKIGRLSENAKLPPLCLDFEKNCHSYRLDIHSSTKKEVTLSPFAKKRHRELSAFFARMDFLGTGLALRKKGPNLRLRRDRNLIREIWEYHYSPKVTSALIEASVYGGTIREACQALTEKYLQEETDAAAASDLLIRSFEMGLSLEIGVMRARLEQVIRSCEDFFTLTKTFSNLIMLMDMQELYGYPSDLLPLRSAVADKLLSLLVHMSSVKDEDVPPMLEALKELYRVLLEAGQEGERAYFSEILEKMSGTADLNPALAGAVWGLLYAYGKRTSGEVAVCMRGYLLSSGEKAARAADYVRGLFYVARDIIFARDGMIDMLDDFLGRTDYEGFIQILPQLRLAFSFFTPAEMDRLAGMVAGKYGLKRGEFRELSQVTDEEYAYGRELEARIWQSART